MLTRLTPDLPVGGLPEDPELRRLWEALVNHLERLNKEGVIDLADAAITATKGIVFPATAVDQSNVNTLDDYEEGTWTPTILGTTTAGAQTYSGQVGRYTKIGRLVAIEGSVILSAKDVLTAGSIRIGGLPFTAANVASMPGMGVSFYRNINFAAGYAQLGVQVVQNTTQLALIQSGDNVGEGAIAAADIGNTSGVGFAGVYTV
jgi:hypothetical protein